MSFIDNLSSAIFVHAFKSPTETIQIRFQSQEELCRSGILLNKYENLSDCFNSICLEEGFLTLWKGNLVYVVRYSASQILTIFLKGPISKLKRENPSNNHNNSGLKNYIHKFLVGTIPIVFPLSIVYPLDVTKVLLINDLNGKYANGLVCLRNVFQVHGFQGIYTGFLITILGAFLYRAIYFALYDAGKSVFCPRNQIDSSKYLKSFFWGMFVTTVSGIICYPFDTIRKRMITSLFTDKPYNGSAECAKSIWNNEGLKGFFVGAGISVLGGLISTSAQLIYDSCFGKGRKKK